MGGLLGSSKRGPALLILSSAVGGGARSSLAKIRVFGLVPITRSLDRKLEHQHYNRHSTSYFFTYTSGLASVTVFFTGRVVYSICEPVLHSCTCGTGRY